MDAWKNASVLQENHDIKFLVLGGGISGFFLGGGGEVPILFLWALPRTLGKPNIVP